METRILASVVLDSSTCIQRFINWIPALDDHLIARHLTITTTLN